MQEADVREQWLRHVWTLAEELETATQALAAGRLEALEASISRQRQLCAQLEHQAATLGRLQGEQLATPMAVRMRSAIAAVDGHSRRYAALLRHCGHSLKMWMAVEREREGCLHTAAPAERTWSCEA